MTLLATLAFFAAALIASVSILGTILRYRDVVLANIAADRDLAMARDFYFRVFEFGRQVAAVGKVRRSGQRVATRRPITPAGLRAAA